MLPVSNASKAEFTGFQVWALLAMHALAGNLKRSQPCIYSLSQSGGRPTSLASWSRRSRLICLQSYTLTRMNPRCKDPNTGHPVIPMVRIPEKQFFSATLQANHGFLRRMLYQVALNLSSCVCVCFPEVNINPWSYDWPEPPGPFPQAPFFLRASPSGSFKVRLFKATVWFRGRVSSKV